jgi:hypothetical protein
MAVACEAANARAIPAHHDPIAVMLDFVNPQQDSPVFRSELSFFPEWIIPIFVYASMKPTDKMTSIGNNPGLAKDRMVILIEGSLMTGGNRSAPSKVAAGSRWRLRNALAGNLIVPRKVLASGDSARRNVATHNPGCAATKIDLSAESTWGYLPIAPGS